MPITWDAEISSERAVLKSAGNHVGFIELRTVARYLRIFLNRIFLMPILIEPPGKMNRTACFNQDLDILGPRGRMVRL